MAYQSLPTFGDLQATGNLSALDDVLILQANGASGSIINVSGTWVGTIVVEGSNDRFTTNQNVTLWSPPVGFISTGVTTNGYYRLAAIAGFTQIRARMSAFTSGSATIVLSTSSGTATVAALSPNAASFKTSSSTNDGTGNAITSQVSGSQRALDIGIDVAGVQVDPRQIRTLTSADTVSVQALSVGGLTINGTVTANIGTTNGLALDTSVSGLVVTQGSATSGEKGPLVQGAVTTADPTYTTGQTSPLSITTRGRLRVDTSSSPADPSIAPTASSISDYVKALKVYTTVVSVNMASSGTDNPLLLLRNPSGSGKTMYLYKTSFGVAVANVFATFKLFSNPTITTNGSAVTPVSNSVGGGAPASTMLTNSLPTISSTGRAVGTYVIGQNVSSLASVEDFSVHVQPNNSVLITGNPGSNNRQAEVTIVWAEV